MAGDLVFNENDPVIAAFQTLEGFKGEWSERPALAAPMGRLAHVGEAWVSAMLERHGLGFNESVSCGLHVCEPTVNGILRLLARRDITPREAQQTTFFSGWWNGLGTGAELRRG